MNEKPYTISDVIAVEALAEELRRRFSDDINGALIVWTKDTFLTSGWSNEGVSASAPDALRAVADYLDQYGPNRTTARKGAS